MNFINSDNFGKTELVKLCGMYSGDTMNIFKYKLQKKKSFNASAVLVENNERKMFNFDLTKILFSKQILHLLQMLTQENIPLTSQLQKWKATIHVI